MLSLCNLSTNGQPVFKIPTNCLHHQFLILCKKLETLWGKTSESYFLCYLAQDEGKSFERGQEPVEYNMLCEQCWFNVKNGW